MTSIQYVQEKMQISTKIYFFGFWHDLDEKGGTFYSLFSGFQDFLYKMVIN
jgi:hypothetical protein